jgi:signal transduction histidine kinase
MSSHALPRRIAGRATVRMRLTALYAALLLASGTLLLAVTYGLVRESVTEQAAITNTTTKPPAKSLLILCKEAVHPFVKQPSPKVQIPLTPDLAAKCRAVYASGAQAGADAVRASTLHNLVVDWVLALAVLTVLSALLGWWLAGRALRPVATITAAARRAASGDLGTRLALSGPRDELHELAGTFDHMLERIQAAFEAQRQFIANASHELRTPLAVMRTTIDVTLAKPNPQPDDIEAMTADVQRAVARSEALVDALLALAQSEQSGTEREPIDLATLAEDALDDAAPAIQEKQLTVEPDLKPATVQGDPVLVGRMIGNLVANATRHNYLGGWVRVETTADEAGSASVTVENTGEHIPAELVAQLFEPFKRMHDRMQNDGGLGLGLSIARAVAQSHGGSLETTSRADGGLTITVRLPGAAQPLRA